VVSLAVVLGPFIGQNLGAGNHERIRKSVKYSNRFAVLWGIGTYVFLAVTAYNIAGIFNKDPVVIKTVAVYLRLAALGYTFYGVMSITVSVLNVLRKPLHAAAINTVQMFILYIPLAFVGSYLLGLKGVFISIAISYTLSGIIAYFVQQKQLSVVINNGT
jgi:Na+-driven multidrug efflux pump